MSSKKQLLLNIVYEILDAFGAGGYKALVAYYLAAAPEDKVDRLIELLSTICKKYKKEFTSGHE
jgi:hypothetical protein